jgi:uncharacterized damage-inducible protein DinB
MRSHHEHHCVRALLAVTLMALGAISLPAQQARPASTSTAASAFKASVVTDADNLSQKFTGLARAMAGKYEWRPGAGVRSAGEVFNLIVMENRLLASVLTGAAAPNGPPPAPITDAAQLAEALRGSYAAVREAAAALSEGDLASPVKLFGMDMTKQGALSMLLGDQHEHLGQSIAYARSNGIVPPWSLPTR